MHHSAQYQQQMFICYIESGQKWQHFKINYLFVYNIDITIGNFNLVLHLSKIFIFPIKNAINTCIEGNISIKI